MNNITRVINYYGVVDDDTEELVDEHNNSLGSYSYVTTKLPLNESNDEYLIVDSLETDINNLYYDINKAETLRDSLSKEFGGSYSVIRFSCMMYSCVTFDTIM